jgi:hypothetical protein
MPEIRVAALLNRLKADHRVRSGLDVSMVLLNQVVQVPRGPDLLFLRQHAVGLYLTHRPMRGSIPIERDRLRRLALIFDCLPEKGFGRSHVALCPEHAVCRLAGSIHRPVQINSLATNLQVRFVDTP